MPISLPAAPQSIPAPAQPARAGDNSFRASSRRDDHAVDGTEREVAAKPDSSKSAKRLTRGQQQPNEVETTPTGEVFAALVETLSSQFASVQDAEAGVSLIAADNASAATTSIPPAVALDVSMLGANASALASALQASSIDAPATTTAATGVSLEAVAPAAGTLTAPIAAPDAALVGEAEIQVQPQTLPASNASEEAADASNAQFTSVQMPESATGAVASSAQAKLPEGLSLDDAGVVLESEPGHNAPVTADAASNSGSGSSLDSATSNTPFQTALSDAATNESVNRFDLAQSAVAPSSAVEATESVQATTTTRAAAPAPHSQIVSVLTPLRREADGTYHLSLRLDPLELGEVRVEVDMKNGEISLSLHAGNQQARDVLKASLADLRAELETSGLRTGSLDVGRDSNPSNSSERSLSSEASQTTATAPEPDIDVNALRDRGDVVNVSSDSSLDIKL